MASVETTISITIPEEGMTLEDLEAAVAQAVVQAGQELLVAGCAAMEARVLR